LTAPYFSYMGVSYSPASTIVLWWSWLIALVPVLCLPIRSARPSLVVYYILYGFVVVPTSLIPAYIGDLPVENLLALQIAIVMCFALLGVVYLVPLSRLPRIRISTTWFFILLATFSGVAYLSIMHYVGFAFRFPNPLTVYDVRSDYNELAENLNSTWLGYCENWQAFVINPFLVAYGLLSRRYYVSALGLIGQLLIYALAGLK